MEEEFKRKMAEKFAEDERIEQLNAQKRRLKEAEHKRAIEELWNEKLTAYKIEREREWEEKRKQDEQERIYQEAVAEYKRQMLEEHAALLTEYNPKAASQYAVSVKGGESQHGSVGPKGSIR